MAYTSTFSMALGASRTGLTLAAQIVGTDGIDIGGEISSGFVEIGTGTYMLTISIVDDTRGVLKVYEQSAPATILAIAAINPEELEPVAAVDVAAIDAQLSATHGAGSWGAASGSGLHRSEYIVYLPDGVTPIPDVDVWITSDEAGLLVIAYGKTGIDGKAIFYLDPGTYYVWRSKTGYYRPDGADTIPETYVVEA